MKHERKTVPIIFAAMLFFAIILILSGCSSGKSSTVSPSPTSVTSPTASPSSGNVLVTSNDGSISLSVPSGWNTNDTSLWPGAAIGVSNDANSQYVVVVEHPNSTLPTNYTLNQFLTYEKAAFDLIATNTVWGQTSNISIGGIKGITVELKGTGKKSHTNFVYWISLLQGKNGFYNVTGWTVDNMAGTNKPIIQNVINSFKEKS